METFFLTLYRPFDYQSDARRNRPIIGQLYLCRCVEDGFDDTYICDTLEPPLRSVHSYIPEGMYDVKMTYSPKFHRNLPLLVNVPKRKGIRIHAGNTASDTLGCILVGRKSPRDNDTLVQSRDCLKDVLTAFKDHNIVGIRIVEDLPF